MKHRILVVGCGYFGKQLCRALPPDIFDIFATTRQKSRFSELNSVGAEPVLFDVMAPGDSDLPANLNSVVYCVGYDRSGAYSRQEIYVQGMRNFLSVFRQPVESLVYVSSTGVYGQSSGERVDETTPVEPKTESGKSIVQAETELSSHSPALRTLILRFAGIYGPQRIPNQAKLATGPMTVPNDSYLNLIHVDDAAGIVKTLISQNPAIDSGNSSQAEEREEVFEIMNLTDGNPVDRREFYRFVAAESGLPEPDFLDPNSKDKKSPNPSSPLPRSSGSVPDDSTLKSATPVARGSTSKKISNGKLLSQIDYQFQYPTFREGIRAILSEH